MPQKLVLKYAYGRTVENTQELRDAWDQGEDFHSSIFGYCSKRDIEELRNNWDAVVITAPSTDNKAIFEIPVFTHLLAGVTNYV